MVNSAFRFLRYGIEFLGFRLSIAVFRTLGPSRGSWFGGWLARTIGPCLPVHRVAQINLKHQLHSIPAQEHAKILKNMWDHWGRVCAEYCHLDTLRQCIQIQNRDVIEGLQDKPCVFVTAHLGNFQAIAAALQYAGFRVTQVYRQANNPWVDHQMRRFQQQVCTKVAAKGEGAPKVLVESLRAKQAVLVLVDQKFAQGPLLPFLGYPAHTMLAPATLAKKYQCPLIPVRAERLKGMSFRVTFHPALDTSETPEAIMTQVNEVLKGWILQRPDQWFWVHKRWPWRYSSRA